MSRKYLVKEERERDNLEKKMWFFQVEVTFG